MEHRHASGPRRSTPGALAPVRVLLSRSITAYSAPSVPLAGTSRFPGTAGYTRRLRCAGAPRRPASGSVLSLRVLSRHVVLCDPGELVGCMCPVPSPTTLALRLGIKAWRSRQPPPSAPRGESHFGASWFACGPRPALQPIALLAPQADRTGHTAQPTRAFPSALSPSWSPFSTADMATAATGKPPPAGLSPARTSASIAAQCRRRRTTRCRRRRETE